MKVEGLWKLIDDNHTVTMHRRISGFQGLMRGLRFDVPIIWDCVPEVQWIKENIVEPFRHDHSMQTILFNVKIASMHIPAYRSIGFQEIWNRRYSEIRVSRILNCEVDQSVLDRLDEIWSALRPLGLHVGMSTTHFINAVRDVQLGVFGQDIYDWTDDYTPWNDPDFQAGCLEVFGGDFKESEAVIADLFEQSKTAPINAVHFDGRQLKRRDLIRALTLYGTAGI